MSNHRVLRKKPRISYFEPDDAYSDEHVYCEKCGDFVYEYCSIHGPLLIVSDDKIPRYKPSNIPNAALTVPHVFLHLAKSSIPGAGIGVFATLTLPRGVRFGPYRGQRVKQCDGNFDYCWQIYEDNEPSHIISAADASRSNWLRYVNCARHYQEQNLLAYQFIGDIYYRTIKIIPKHTELLVFYGSECAASLNVDLSKYNNNKYYREIKETAKDNEMKNTRKLNQKSEAQNSKPTTTTIEIVSDDTPTTGIDSEHIIIDNFKYIDDIADKVNEEADPKTGRENIELMKTDVNSINVKQNKQGNIQYLKTGVNIPDELNADEKYKQLNIQYLKTDVNSTNELNLNRKYINFVKTGVNYTANDNIQFLKKYVDFTDENGYVPNFYNNTHYIGKENIQLKLNVDQRYEQIHKTDGNGYIPDINNQSKNKETKSVIKQIQIERNEKLWYCEKCNKTFKLRSKNRHEKHMHSDNFKYFCNGCTFKTNSEYSFKKHIQAHDNDFSIHCHLCTDYVTNTHKNLQNHINRIHVSQRRKTHKCDYCNYKSSQKVAMEKHIRLHFKINVKKCDHCDYITDANRNLKMHVRTHSDPAIFQCYLCPYKTPQKSAFTYHRNNAHVTPNFSKQFVDFISNDF